MRLWVAIIPIMEAANARRVLVGCSLTRFVARPPRCVARMLRGARPVPLPLALLLPKRPVGAERCPAFGPGVFMRGPALPRSPRAPLPLYVSVCVCGCVRLGVWWYPSCVRGRWRCSGPLGRPPPSALWRGCRMPPDVPRPPPPPALAVRVWSRGAPPGALGGPLARPL